jgi:hypothetical protein
VEGFSNLLWTLLLSPLFALGLFHPVAVPKLLGAVGALASLAWFQRTLGRITGSPLAGCAAALAVAASPPVVIWTSSGLENGLLLPLAVLLWRSLSRGGWRGAALGGAAAGLASLTRPDGLLYAGAALFLLLPPPAGEDVPRRRRGGEAALFLGVWAAIWGPVLLFRLRYFGLPVPHTYYAKRIWASEGEHLAAVLADPSLLWRKWLDLAAGIAGTAGPWLLPAAAALLALGWWRRRLSRLLAAALVVQGIAVAAFLWLDDDWMGEYRFGTVAAAFSLLTLVAALDRAVSLLPPGRWKSASRVAPLVLALFLAAGFLPRTFRFAANPPTSFQDVRERCGERFNRFAAALDLKGGSLLTADLGGTLMTSHLAVHDLAGLCEPAVVATLRKNGNVWHYDHPEFYDWVFERVRPTFISTAKFWTAVPGFELDPRFARDYVAIESFRDEYSGTVYGRDLHSGDFVRREAAPDGPTLARLRASYRPAARPDPLPHRLADRWGSLRGGGGDPAALGREARAALDRGDPNRAATLLGRADALAPGDPGTLHLLAWTLDDTGRTAEARPVWERLLAVAVGRGEADLARAARERLEGYPAPVRTVTAEEREQVLADLMRQGLELLHARGDASGAARVFRTVLLILPTHYGATYQLAEALDREGRPAEALPLWRRVRDMALGYGDKATAEGARERIARGASGTEEAARP